MATISNKPLPVPFTILIDQREGMPYFFHGMRANASRSHRPLVVETKFAHLKTGDYTIEGLEDLITIERKSLSDLFSTLGQNRRRFEAEHERMSQMNFAAVVVEADAETILKSPPEGSKLLPKSVYGTYLSWSMRYGVHWYLCEDRRLAELTTFRLLEKFYSSHVSNVSNTENPQGKETEHGNPGCNPSAGISHDKFDGSIAGGPPVIDSTIDVF